MRRLGVMLVTLAIGMSSCAGGTPTRTVQVDYRNDEFGSHYWRYFPNKIEAHPGDTVVFHQQWTGEPHTVTFGRIVDRALPRVDELDTKYESFDFESASPDEQQRVQADYDNATKGLPVFDPYRDAAAQNAEQPCYLKTGAPPTDPKTACAKRFQKQPVFNGRHAYYSSGFIPPSGPQGSEFRVPLSKDVRPGTYRFYCVIHFPFMAGRLEVRPPSVRLPSATEVQRRANAEIQALAGPLRKAFSQAHANDIRTAGVSLRRPIAGYHSGEEFTAAIDSFIPKRITTRVGTPVTWTIIGAHTVSFGVPRYLPIYVVQEDGTVRRNPKVDAPQGGSPAIPPADFTKHSYKVDGGTYTGSGFYSSGLLGSEPYSTYTLRFAEPGRYRYACLVHPPMVGTVVVNP